MRCMVSIKSCKNGMQFTSSHLVFPRPDLYLSEQKLVLETTLMHHAAYYSKIHTSHLGWQFTMTAAADILATVTKTAQNHQTLFSETTSQCHPINYIALASVVTAVRQRETETTTE